MAAVNGHAIAGGCVLLSACDLALMAEGRGRVGVPELLVGVPFPAVALEGMRAALTPAVFREAVYEGTTYSVGESLQRGFINDIVAADQLLPIAISRAQSLAAISPTAFALTKEIDRAPSQEFLAKHKKELNARAFEGWTSVETRESIRDYVQRTIGRS